MTRILILLALAACAPAAPPAGNLFDDPFPRPERGCVHVVDIATRTVSCR